MAEEKWTCIIDKDLRPAYYDSFHCLMGDCRMSCCKGWRIPFDKKDYLKLKRHLESQSELAERMEHGLHRLREKNAIDGYYAQMQMDERGCCRMLTEDGLCGLQLAVGEEALPEVCRTYPRGGGARISGYWERTLSPSCEAVLRQLWNLPGGVDFVSDPLPKEKWRVRQEEVVSYLTPWFQDIRAVCIGLLQDRSIPLNQRIFLMGLRLQALMDESVDIPAWLAETEGLRTTEKPFLQGLLDMDDNALSMNLNNNIQFLLDANSPVLYGIKASLLATQMMIREKEIGPSYYREMQAEFDQIYGQQEYFFENLAVSIFYHLVCPSVTSPKDLWKSYVAFCQIWSVYRFLAVLSVRVQLPPLQDRPEETPPVPGSREALFQFLTIAGRVLLHSREHTDHAVEKAFQKERATLAHMAILLGG